MEVIWQSFNTAYVLFSFMLGIYAAVLAGRNVPISGEFWGAMWTNTGLASAILIMAIILTIQGLEPIGIDPDNPSERIIRTVYYLYAVYFVISLPGVFAIMRGNDNQRTALLFGGVALFNAAAAYRAGNILISGWE